MSNQFLTAIRKFLNPLILGIITATVLLALLPEKRSFADSIEDIVERSDFIGAIDVSQRFEGCRLSDYFWLYRLSVTETLKGKPPVSDIFLITESVIDPGSKYIVFLKRIDESPHCNECMRKVVECQIDSELKDERVFMAISIGAESSNSFRGDAIFATRAMTTAERDSLDILGNKEFVFAPAWSFPLFSEDNSFLGVDMPDGLGGRIAVPGNVEWHELHEYSGSGAATWWIVMNSEQFIREVLRIKGEQ